MALGKGATVATGNIFGGTTNSDGVITAISGTGGVITLANMPTTLTLNGGGKVFLMATGTITTLTCNGQGPGQSAPIVDCSEDPRTKTFTNHTFIGGSCLNDPNKTTVWSNAGTWDQASVDASTLGSRYSLLRT